MKVLVVARSFTRGGAATGAANLCLALETAGLEVVRVSAERRPGRVFRTMERVVERVLFDAETHCARFGPASIDLAAEVAQNRPDIVQLCDVSANTVAGKALNDLPCPTVHRMSDFWPYHGPRHYADRPGAAPALARAMFGLAGHGALMPTARVAPSDWLAQGTKGPGPAPHVILNAVPMTSAAMPRPRPNGRLRLGFIAGKLADSRKGLTRLAAPFRDALEGRDMELLTFGAGPAPRGLEDMPVRHMGPYRKGETARAMEQIDILLCPSRHDNSPNTVSEAMAHGIPVLGQRGTGMESYVAEDRGALIDFWAGDPSELRPVLERMLDGYEAISAAALDFARGPLAPETVGAAYRSLYEDLLRK